MNLARDRWRVRRRRRPEALVADAARLPARPRVTTRPPCWTGRRCCARAGCCRRATRRPGAPVLGGPVDRGDGGRARVHPGHREIPYPPCPAAAAHRIARGTGRGHAPGAPGLARRFARSRMGPFPGSGGSTVLTDHDVTEELAAAFHDQADPVTRTALDPAGIFPRGARARRRRAAIRVAAAGAAATALAVVVTVANLGAGPAPGPGAAPRPPGLLLDAAVTGPPPAAPRPSGMPRYYVTTDHFRPVAAIRDSATGKVLSTVTLPRRIDPKASQIAAAGDGRTFALALLSFPRTRFYRLRVADGGRSARLTRLNAAPLTRGSTPRASRSPRRAQAGGGHPGQRWAARHDRSGVAGHRRDPDLDHHPGRSPGRGVLGRGSHARVLLGGRRGAGQFGLWTLDTAAPGLRPYVRPPRPASQHGRGYGPVRPAHPGRDGGRRSHLRRHRTRQPGHSGGRHRGTVRREGLRSIPCSSSTRPTRPTRGSPAGTSAPACWRRPTAPAATCW